MTKTDLALSKAFEELEAITKKFESGEIDLEQGIPKFKRGLELAKLLKKRLSQIENELKEVKADFEEPKEESTIQEPPVEEIQGDQEEDIPF